MTNNNIIQRIGNTSLVRLSRIGNGYNIYAKLENENPSGSVKDRIVKKILEAAEKRGELTKEKTLLEVSMGNTGISVAMFAASCGYKAEIVVPQSARQESKFMIRSYGARLNIREGDIMGALAYTERLAEEGDYFYVNQLRRKETLDSGKDLGRELLEQLKDVDILVACCGIGGTICGAGMALKEARDVQVITAVPEEGSYIPGVGDFRKGFKPPLIDERVIDEVIEVSDITASETMHQISSLEGIFAGLSSGAALHVALEYAKKYNNKGKNIVTIFPDSGDRYLSLTK